MKCCISCQAYDSMTKEFCLIRENSMNCIADSLSFSSV